ncbi:hypothetical protein CN680_21995 [Bacillus pseudomycoides]|uniref:hypothetical protein n=1 Tax=Bacillus pseudomycoides TaxID=64104 RepID=UPI000BEE63CC|nr:hypothetical protein [Bacillus pseudomycoides]PED69535.1 hypothetical protein CON97_24650 [Bacillus pseudomycoides]PEI38869.1 hypothetical protein CN620_20075 [Bacillus pseudomycoides]PEJ72262.1 hypothetical protein CN680_21995 [Bacillus pseudomycoides]PEM12876.1 hypothetical protein CN628_19605 [Bacillus pseudomycoides]PEP04036.1 hypothetical protein CN550_01470 [Bacillus pseudomycoides]
MIHNELFIRNEQTIRLYQRIISDKLFSLHDKGDGKVLNVHINILAQLLYEAFKEIDLTNSPVVPVLIISNPVAVQSIYVPGIYTMNFVCDEFMYICDVDRLQNEVATLAIGYTIQHSRLERLLDEEVEKVLLYMIKRINKFLDIHGELTCSFEIAVKEDVLLYENNLSPVFLCQWIVNREE